MASQLNGNLCRKQLRKYGQGSSVIHIYSSELKNVVVLFPPLAEQQKIASILTSVDQVIEKTESEISKLQDLKKGMMQQLLTQGIGHTQFKDSSVGKIPVGWEVKALSQEITIKHGFAFEGDYFSITPNNYILMTPGNFHKNGNLYFGTNTKYYTGPIPKDYILVNGDALVVMTDLTKEMTILGNTVILESTKKVLHNQRIGKLIQRAGSFNTNFLVLLMNSSYVKKHVKLTATGTTVRHTSPSKILEVQVPAPPLDEQQKITDILTSIDDSIQQQQRELQQTQNLKKSLMQDLLTGKVRVKVD